MTSWHCLLKPKSFAVNVFCSRLLFFFPRHSVNSGTWLLKCTETFPAACALKVPRYSRTRCWKGWEHSCKKTNYGFWIQDSGSVSTPVTWARSFIAQYPVLSSPIGATGSLSAVSREEYTQCERTLIQECDNASNQTHGQHLLPTSFLPKVL